MPCGPSFGATGIFSTITTRLPNARNAQSAGGKQLFHTRTILLGVAVAPDENFARTASGDPKLNTGGIRFRAHSGTWILPVARRVGETLQSLANAGLDVAVRAEEANAAC